MAVTGQDAPFQCSALPSQSTTMHDVVEPQETASTPSPVTSMLSGLDQTCPFQVRASPPSTAMQNEALRQDTSISANAPPGSNDVFSFQVVPL